jgi:hypothetical protein
VVSLGVTIVEGVRAIQAGETNPASLRLLAVLWLMLGIAFVLGWSILRRLRADEGDAEPPRLVLTGRVVLMLVALGAWVGILANRLPCVIGSGSCG